MRASRRWRPWTVVVVVVLVAAGTAWWLGQRADSVAGRVSVDVVPTSYVLGEHGARPLAAKVTNESGRELTGAQVRLWVGDPGGDLPVVNFSEEMYDPECGVEDPGPLPECEAAEKRAKAQKCDTRKLGAGNREPGVVCDGDLPKGEGEYEFKYGIGDLPSYEELADLVEYPDLTVRAEVLVDGQRVATAKAKLSVGLPEGYGRLEVSPLPQDMAIDDPASRTHAWSFTVTNDTGADVEDATIEVALNSGGGFAEIDSSHEGCEQDSTIGQTRDEVNCSGVDIAAGEKLTVDLSMNVAAGAAGRFEEYCPPGSPTDEQCRADAAELPLLIDVLADGTFGYAKDSVTLLVGD